jgi:xanthine dehydrogenase YagR molybdenum-binding subunit
MNRMIGEPASRVDGPAKVTGSAIYAGEFDVHGLAHSPLAHATLVLSRIPRGRIVSVDMRDALAARGVLTVISHDNAPRLPYRELDPRPAVDPKSGQQLKVFQGPEILFSGQPIAVVVAETQEEARHAAELVRVTYEVSGESGPATRFDRSRARPPSDASAQAGRPGDAGRGDGDAALAKAEVSIDAWYSHPREHHAAIEPHVTIASWNDDALTLYDKSQWVENCRREIAHVFGMEEEKIRVLSPFVGGAFGSALRTWPHVTIAALAAREVRRPVRLELSRRDLYTNTGYRPHTEQRVALGADRDGRLAAIVHEAYGQTSTYEEYAETTLNPTRSLYSCPDVSTRYRLVEMDVNTPCPMRAPGTVSGILALETAMDELAVALDMDPLELRLRNYAEHDEDKDLPFSSKELRACYEQAAARFGWARRKREPRSMRDGRMLIGQGMASAVYPAHRGEAKAHVTLFANGTARVVTASSDMGPGTYTAISQVAAETLGLPLEQVHFELGDTDMPSAAVHGGSITMATIGNAVADACAGLVDELFALASQADGPLQGQAREDMIVNDGVFTSRQNGAIGVPIGELLRRHGRESLAGEGSSAPGGETESHSSAAFGAVFAEVRVDEDFGSVRVTRIVGGYDAGRIVNPRLARSQCLGGMVQGLGMALFEAAEWDEGLGRVMNANLAEYLMPVCADIGELEAFFVESDDRIFNPLGVKGVAEVAICGVGAAIANAVYHATGRRLRDLPITPDKLLRK